ncbi:MAG TPA: metallophosphoesterase [Stellaceae bacterium]|nr:metallophosphoesterase [Stellaceae bacterium]
METRRGFMKCLAWAGTGIVWTVAGGVPKGMPLGLGLGGEAQAATTGGLTFVQISDSHIGFKAEANPDPNGTLKAALDKIAALPNKPAMMIHTGDVTHLSKPEEFDTADQIIKGAKIDTHFIPGEHDVIGDDGKMYFERFGGKGAAPGGWYSFDQGGVHFVGLMNVIGFGPSTGGTLGKEQIEWLEKDLKGKSASTPIVVMAHIPLWSIYPQWGWTTGDADAAFTHLKPFGSVTVLNGHIHQVVQRVEGKVTFQTAMSTAFPQPTAGSAPNPGPMKVGDKLKTMLGIREIEIAADGSPKLTDETLA